MRRLTHIDNAKALGMVFIVASHIGITNNAINNIYTLWCDILGSFYVPLFFILSGCFESQTYDITKLKKRIIKLIKYCVIFYTFGVIMDGIICNHWTLTHCTSQTTIWFLFVLIWITLIVGI
ncbi:acyltransferase family protein [Phocaeicola plebeius]|jgi:fucose 4-O-acetylase-like acetyltransferase